jgi:hypothetical protein
MIMAVAVTYAVQAEMPLGFSQAMNNAAQRDILAVKNYDSGASLTEDYSDVEHLERNTVVKTGRYGANSSAQGVDGGAIGTAIGQPGGLEASISSNVIGTAHIAWQSFDPIPSDKGRHQLLGRSVEELTGVFSIEKFIQLWSDSPPGEISVDWLPCG